ncbi:unnamed protein product, partial [Rotaria magnacalcarata]
TPLDSTGLHWTPLDSTGLHWTPLDSIGLHWTPLDWSPLFPPCEDDIANVLNLAVVVGHEDIQSLRAFSTEQTHPENGSLNVAFIDETDVERQKNQ